MKLDADASRRMIAAAAPAAPMTEPPCPLCVDDGGVVLWRDAFCRVVLAAEPDYPGFCRVILERHVRETSDLDAAAQTRLMTVVFAVEAEVRRATGASKMNVASLGNVVPHVHWHVVPRRPDDPRFPDPVWGPPRRASTPPPWPTDGARRLADALRARLG